MQSEYNRERIYPKDKLLSTKKKKKKKAEKKGKNELWDYNKRERHI